MERHLLFFVLSPLSACTPMQTSNWDDMPYFDGPEQPVCISEINAEGRLITNCDLLLDQ